MTSYYLGTGLYFFILNPNEMKFIMFINIYKTNIVWHFNIYKHEKYNILEFKSKNILHSQHIIFMSC